MPFRPAALALVAAFAACSSPTAEEDTSGSSSSGDANPTTTGDPCPVGAEGCACTAGEGCDAGLACEQDICVAACAPGDLGCECSQGAGCLSPWSCVAGVCVDCVAGELGCVCDDAACSVPLGCVEGLCVQGSSPSCGDGVVDEFEECDDGTENSDGALAGCTSACRLPRCGDGIIQTGEACDGGSTCGDDCTLVTCGNGQLDEGEACEPAGEDDPECTQACTDARKLIFVTSVHYTGGEIGGVAGADEKCQALAEAAGRPGQFMAWLASSTEDAPAVRFTWWDLPYVDAAGEVLAETAGGIERAALLTESGGPISESDYACQSEYLAWSSTRLHPDGQNGTEYDCADWTDSAAAGSLARLTAPPNTGASGIASSCWNQPCTIKAALTCVEQ